MRTARTVVLFAAALSLLVLPVARAQKKESAEKYRVVTSDDGLSCTFSQDLSVSLGSPTSVGTMRASADHFRCIDKAKKEVEIELVSTGLEGGKVAIRTKQFGTVYRGNEEGKFSTYEMTDSQIRQLKAVLGLK